MESEKIFEIDEHIMNKFSSSEGIEVLKSITDSRLDDLQNNKIYKIQIISLVVDIVESKKISKFYGPESWSKIISEFMYGITKIIKDYDGKWITIQGDAIMCIFDGSTNEDIDKSFNCACFINTFIRHLNKKINYFSSNVHEVKIGIGLWFSFDNYASKVGIKNDKDIVFIGESVNFASMLANNANRNGHNKILFNDLFKNNFSDDEKTRQNQIGGITWQYVESDGVWGCDYIFTKYENIINNNIK